MYRILHTLAQRPGRTGSGIFLNSLIHQAALKNLPQAVIIGIPAETEYRFEELAENQHYPVYFNSPDLPFPVPGMSDAMPYASTKYSELNDDMLNSWSRAFEKRLHQVAKEFKPQVVVAHHLWLLTGLVREIFPDIPVIAISHGTDLRQLKLAPNLKPRVINSCRNVDLILALSKFQKEQIISNYGISKDKIRVTGCAYNSEIFYPVAKSIRRKSKLKLVYCGKLSKAKGVMQLLEVFNSITQKYRDLELILIGSGQGEEAEKIRELAAGISAKISFTGSLPQAEVGNIFRQCDIFVLPSFYEGLGLVVLEALACGLKVVTTAIPGLSKWLGDKINCSGQISYVKLPRLINTDQPVVEDLEVFKADLGKAILDMIEICKSDHSEIYCKEIEKRSWEQLFNRIHLEIQKRIS